MPLNSDYQARLLAELAKFPHIKRWWVAFSGGLDSTVLLHLAWQAGLADSHQLGAIHIDHQLQADSAVWAVHCQTCCEQWQLPLRKLQVAVAAGEGPEDQARRARYQAFAENLSVNEGLLMAHHLDDQAETLLLRLLRGAGSRGLSGIPVSRPLGQGLLLRPLLGFSRQQLHEYAEQQQLTWIEDPSNGSERYDRNYLRQQVMPLLRQRWPDAATAMARSADYCAESEQLNQQLAELDLAATQQYGMAGQGLQLAALRNLPETRQVNLLRYWLSQKVHFLPDRLFCDRLLQQMLSAREDALPAIDWQGLQICRFQQVIYLVDPRWQAPGSSVDWDGQQVLDLAFAKLHGEQRQGQGVRWQPGQRLRLSFRQGGERLRLAGREGSRSLKKIFQEQQVPTWLRGLMPLLLVDEQPAALLGFAQGPLVLEGFQLSADETGLFPVWCFTEVKNQQQS